MVKMQALIGAVWAINAARGWQRFSPWIAPICDDFSGCNSVNSSARRHHAAHLRFRRRVFRVTKPPHQKGTGAARVTISEQPCAEQPFALPKKLEPDLARVVAYWDALKRGEAEVPFWDDVNPTSLPELAAKLFMIDTLDKPMRFRFSFGVVGAEVKRAHGGVLDGRFLDEIEARPPLQFLLSQCSATVESRRPTYYRHAAAPGGSNATHGYSRLMLPLWGDSGIGLLGAFALE
jgi:hypothetical protein